MNPMSSDSGTRNSLYPLTSDISSTFDVMKTSPYYSVEPCQSVLFLYVTEVCDLLYKTRQVPYFGKMN